MVLWGSLLFEATALIVLLAMGSSHTRQVPRSLTAFACLLVVADLLYEARPTFISRYPYNFFVESLYVLAFALVSVVCHRALQQQSMPTTTKFARRFARAFCWFPYFVCFPSVSFFEWHYLWWPLVTENSLPLWAREMCALYAAAHALCASVLIATLLRSSHLSQLCMWSGLGVLVAGDFESRFVALHHLHSSAGVGTAGWTLGFVLFVFGLLSTSSRAPPVSALALRPSVSVQVIIALATSGVCLFFVTSSMACGYLRCDRADSLGHLAIFFWLATTAFAALGMLASQIVSQSAALLPRPSLSLRHAPKQIVYPAAARHWVESQQVVKAHRRLQRRLVALVVRAREAQERRRRARVVASLLHEWQGPMAALEVLARRETFTRPERRHALALAQEALHRAREVAARAQREGERALSMLPRRKVARRRARMSTATVLQLVRAVRQDVSRRYALKKSDVCISVAPNVPPDLRLRGRPCALRACVLALLVNAFETSPHVRIFIRLRYAPRRRAYELAVRDDGPGLSAKQLSDAGIVPLRSQKADRRGLGLWGVARRARQWGAKFDCYLGKSKGLVCVLRWPAVERR